MSEFNLNIPKMGYFILFRHEGDLIGSAIDREQRKRGFSPNQASFTHVGVSGGGPWMVQVAPPRVKVIDITKVFPGRHILIVKYKGKDYDGRKGAKVAFWSSSKCNMRYDFFGVLRFKIGLLIQWAWRQFCSENAVWALQKEYPTAIEKKPADCMPADFTNLNYFDFVWEGELPNGK